MSGLLGCLPPHLTFAMQTRIFISLLLIFQPYHELSFWCVRLYGNRAAFGLQEEQGRLFFSISLEGLEVVRTLRNDEIGVLK